MLKAIVAIFLFVNCTCVSANQSIDTLKESVLEIDFQDFFKQDRISLSINDCLVFKDLLLSSDKIDGFTGVSVRLYLLKNSKVLVKYMDKELTYKMGTGKLTIKVLLNNNENSYILDIKKGKCIGFSKKNENNLLMNQSNRSFQYD